jgi:hypothetical protein
MIDFIKIKLNENLLDSLLNNELLEFNGGFNRTTAEIFKYPLTAEYNSLKFDIKSDSTIILSGSLHKYWNNIFNDKAHNYNDFCFSDLIKVIVDLINKFKIDPYDSIIQNLEFGVNISTPFSPEEFLNSIINYKGSSFNATHERSMHYLQCKAQQYCIKTYNKGLQYKTQNNILRFEIKIFKMKKIENTNIKTLIDLLDIEKHFKLIEILLSIFKDLLIYDKSTDTKRLRIEEQLLLSNGSHNSYWEELKKNQTANYYKIREKFINLIEKCQGNLIKKNTYQMILEKLQKLFSIKENTLEYLTDLYDFQFTEINHSIIESISFPKNKKYSVAVTNYFKRLSINPDLNLREYIPRGEFHDIDKLKKHIINYSDDRN